MSDSYFCIYCMKEIVPERHEGGNLYIHDDVPHPNDFNQSDENMEN